MDTASTAPQATSADITTKKPAFETELDLVEAFVSEHSFDGKPAPASKQAIEEAEESAYLRHDFDGAQRSLFKARVAALRFHAGQILIASQRIVDQLGQQVEREATFLIGRARISLTGREQNLPQAVVFAEKAYTLLQEQVKNLPQEKPTEGPKPTSDAAVLAAVPDNGVRVSEAEVRAFEAKGLEHIAKVRQHHPHGKGKAEDGSKKGSPKKGTRSKCRQTVAA